MRNSARAREALWAIPCPPDRESWWRVIGSALAEGLSADEVLLWCESGPNFDRAEALSTIRSLAGRPDNGRRGSLYAMARDAGWREPMNGYARPHQRAQKPRKAHGKPDEPSFDFAAAWHESGRATAEHPYVARKLGRPDGLRVYRGALTLNGQALDGSLLVPAFDADGNLQSWQAIPPVGNKRNAPGASIKGASFTVGGTVRDGELVYLVEGVGQAWSAHQATGRPAVVCFGVGNIESIATQLHKQHPKARIVIVADAGKEADAQRIARAVGGAWVGMPEGSPANFDLNDYHQQTKALPAVGELLAQAREPEPEATPVYASLADLDTDPPPPRRWVIDQWLPRGTVTALFGGGGIGKSLLVQQMGTCIANGIDIFGATVMRGPVIAFLCEDDNDEVRRRQRDILAYLGRSAAHSAEGLLIEGRAGFDNVLVTFGADRLPLPSPFLATVERECERIRPALLVLDNIAQLFGGIENDRFMVTAFANVLAGIAHRHDCAVLLLGHVAKARESEYSGSTAWEAAVRTRLWMERREDGLIELHRRKANYAGQAAVVMEYQQGALAEIDEDKRDESAAARAVEPQVLEALAKFTARQVATSHAPTARTYLVTLARKEGLLKASPVIAARALAAMIDDGRIIPNAELPWRKADRHRAYGLARATSTKAESAPETETAFGTEVGDA